MGFLNMDSRLVRLVVMVLLVTLFLSGSRSHDVRVEIQQLGPNYRIIYNGDPLDLLEVNVNITFPSKKVVFRHSHFAVIPRNLFQVYPNAKEFHLNDCKLRVIEKSNFVGGENLKKLSITRNKITKLPSEVFSGMKKLEKLDLHSNKIDEVNDEAFSGLTNVKTLILYGNQIDVLSSEVLKSLVKLKKIDLSRNPILTIRADTFASNGLLESINLDNCGILELDADTFLHLQHLKKAHLTGNAFLKLYLPSLQELHASMSTIKECYVGGSVTQIWLDSNYLDTLQVNDLSQLRHANLSNNSLTDFNFLKSAVNVKSLDLSMNPVNFTLLTSDTFKRMTQLQYLYLSKLSLPDLDPDIFANLTQLKTLDLSNNLFSILDYQVFLPLVNLDILMLGGNEMIKFDEAELRQSGFQAAIMR